MYHTNKSTTFGLGIQYKENLLINGIYTTSNAALSSYANGSFEFGLRARVFGKK